VLCIFSLLQLSAPKSVVPEGEGQMKKECFNKRHDSSYEGKQVVKNDIVKY
jgi:hypothetical protein